MKDKTAANRSGFLVQDKKCATCIYRKDSPHYYALIKAHYAKKRRNRRK